MTRLFVIVETLGSSSNWIGGWLWYYIDRINRENFCYDLTDIDACTIQYTQYGPGQFYNWHQDADIDVFYKPEIIPGSGNNMSQDQVTLNGECVRKLSFALQLSDPTDYTGGEVQFLDNTGGTYFAPKQRGTRWSLIHALSTVRKSQIWFA